MMVQDRYGMMPGQGADGLKPISTYICRSGEKKYFRVRLGESEEFYALVVEAKANPAHPGSRLKDVYYFRMGNEQQFASMLHKLSFDLESSYFLAHKLGLFSLLSQSAALGKTDWDYS